MGSARLGIYLVGLVLVVAAVGVVLTQTEIGRSVPTGVALALILLLVGIGVMASAKSINDSRVSRRVVSDSSAGAIATRGTADPRYSGTSSFQTTPGNTETIVEERRMD